MTEKKSELELITDSRRTKTKTASYETYLKSTHGLNKSEKGCFSFLLPIIENFVEKFFYTLSKCFGRKKDSYEMKLQKGLSALFAILCIFVALVYAGFTAYVGFTNEEPLNYWATLGCVLFVVILVFDIALFACISQFELFFFIFVLGANIASLMSHFGLQRGFNSSGPVVMHIPAFISIIVNSKLSVYYVVTQTAASFACFIYDIFDKPEVIDLQASLLYYTIQNTSVFIMVYVTFFTKEAIYQKQLSILKSVAKSLSSKSQNRDNTLDTKEIQYLEEKDDSLIPKIYVFFKIIIKKFKVLGRELDELIAEKQAEADGIKPTLKINKKMFKINPDDIKLIKSIGSGGSNSTIYKSEWNGTIVAYKLFKRKNFSNQADFNNFEREVSIMSSINHPNIISFYGCTMTENRVGIVIEFCGNGDLMDFIRNKPDLSIDEKMNIIVGIVKGTVYLHDRNIIHRDLKPQNVLISEDLTAKLTDFDCSRVVETDVSMKTQRVGTKYYMAPEVFLGKQYTHKADIFSIGIIMFVLLTNKLRPYSHLPEEQQTNIEHKVCHDNSIRPEIKVDDYPDMKWYIEIMEKSWDENIDIRPELKDMITCFEKKCYLKDL